MDKTKKINLEEFKDLYENKGFTFKELEKQYNCSHTTLKRIARRHNFKMHRGKATNRKCFLQKMEIPLSILETDLMNKIDSRIDHVSLEIILGCLLGDSSFQKFENKKKEWTYHIRFGHCENQLDYLIFKKEFLKDLSGDIYFKNGKKNVIYKDRMFNRQNQYSMSSIRLHIDYIYNMLMKTGRKTVTKEYFEYLTPRSLAFWYMDDGCYKVGKKNVHISTQGFSQEENNLIKDYFYEKLKIPCFLKKVIGGSGYTICLPANSTEKFLKIIKPYMCPCMFYKNPFCSPVETLKIEELNASMSKEDYSEMNNLNNAGQPIKIG